LTTDNESTGSKPENGGAEDSSSPNTQAPDVGAPAAGKNGASNAAEAAPAVAPPSELELLQAERDKLKDQLLRTAADFDNFRKRTRRDIDEARQRSRDDLIRELLPVFDNLGRALQTVGGVSDLTSVVEGVRMVLKLFEDTTERMGLVRVPAVGQRFDPAVHEAIQQKETEEHPPGTVIAEIAAGYRFGERLVRPSMVVVARKPAPAKAAEPAKASTAPSASKAPEAAATGPTTGSTQRPAAAADGAENGAGRADAEHKEADKST
jgi:molecular chaperone GrpE